MTHREIKKRAARYAKFVEWSDEDRCFIGRCPELFEGGVHGDEEAKVYAEVCQAAEEWIKLLNDDSTPLPAPDGRQYSGKFVLRVSPKFHQRLALKAKVAGESLNSFCAKVLSKAAVV
jgi:predicted HicB family RNase H-like nuclease